MTRVLVVGDDPGLRELFAIVLEEEGYIVHAVDDGRAALEALPSFTPDLIVSDIQMPILGGWGLLAKVREQHVTLPVLLISASTTLHPPSDLDLSPQTVLLP